MPVLALECFSAYGTGGLIRGFGLGLLVSNGFLNAKAARCSGLWLTAFDK